MGTEKTGVGIDADSDGCPDNGIKGGTDRGTDVCSDRITDGSTDNGTDGPTV